MNVPDVTTYIYTATSFQDTRRLCDLAKLMDRPLKATILGREVIAEPGDNPHRLYDGFGRSEGGKPVPSPLPITIANVNEWCCR